MKTDVMFSSKTDMWETPRDLFDRYNAIYHFETDVCAIPENAKCAKYFTPEMDGLKQEWSGGMLVQSSIWKRNRQMGRKGSDLKRNRSHIEFIRGRLKFGNATENAPFPSMIVVFNKNKPDKQEDPIGT